MPQKPVAPATNRPAPSQWAQLLAQPAHQDLRGHAIVLESDPVRRYDTIRQLKRMAAGLEAAINGLERSMDRFREDEEAGHG